MKKLFSLISILTVSGLYAQPSFNFPDVAPRAGDVYLMVTSGVHPSPGGAGENQTWDLSAMTQLATVVNSITPVESGSYAANLPNAELQSYDGDNYVFYNTASSTYLNSGYVIGGVVLNYSDEEQLMKFPMDFTSQFTDDWATTYVSGSYEIRRTGTTKVNYDGFGSLITPAGTFKNVARVRTDKVISDASQFGVATTTVTSYAWWILGEHYPLAQIASSTTRGKLSSFSWYRTMGVNPVGLTEAGQSSTSLISYPNPASDVLYVNAVRDKALILEFCDNTGKLLHSETVPSGNSLVKVNVASFDAGIYFVRLRTNTGENETKKVIIQH